MSDWQKVYEDSLAYRAEIVKAVLEDREMNPVIMDKKDSAYQLGHFEIYVPPEHTLQAIRIIKEEIKF
ncbi:MAG: DUF2007 domain-containing protein [Cytophagales bacterium]|nr:DUF2007 domain-containing protein [Cytophagales bacterium]